MEKPLLESLGLSNVMTIRAPTSRPEIMYAVSPTLPMTEARVSDAVVHWYQANLAKHMSESKSQMLVYVPKKKIGTDLAARLGVPFFESQITQVEKLRLYNAFRKGVLRILVATTAFGAGIDVEAVDIVVHAGSPRSMVDFVQESGRGGRGGQPSLSIVFRTLNTFAQDQDGLIEGGAEMERWLSGSTECRRLGLAEYLDGGVTTCASLPQANLCDLCRSMGANQHTILDDIRCQVESRRILKTPRDLHASTRQLPNHPTLMSSPMAPATLAPQVTNCSQTTTLFGTPVVLGSSPFVVPKTPGHGSEYKRQRTESASDPDGAAKRRALLSALCSDLTSPSTALRSVPDLSLPSYSQGLLPLLSALISMKGVCFICLGKGQIQTHGAGCQNERLVTDGGKISIFDAINKLGNFVKFKLSASNHCQQCYLPAPTNEIDNGFHPNGKAGKCLVFASAAPKALICGMNLWVSRIRVGRRVTERGDPAWLRDVVENAPIMLEPSEEAFARFLLTKTDTGELWLVRIFYNMLHEGLIGSD